MSLASTPVQGSSEKRELPSPEYTTELKKNRLQSDTQSDTELSTMEDTHSSSEGSAGELSQQSQITLTDIDLQKIGAVLQQNFNQQVTQQIQESFQTQVSQLVNSIVEGVLAGLHSKIASLEQENSNLKKRVEKLEISADNAEQYSRRNCLRISGVPENNDEVTDNIVLDLATAIDADIKLEDIDRSHRLGKPKSRDSSDDTPARPRDINIKFSTYRARQKVYKARALTKQRGYKGIFINEDLTKNRSLLLYEARRRFKSKQLQGAWSSDGTILIKHFDNTVVKITSVSQLPVFVPLEQSRN